METKVNDAKCTIIEIKAESIEPVTLISKPQSCYELSLVDNYHKIERTVTIKDEKYEDSSVLATKRDFSNTRIAPNDIDIKLDLSDLFDVCSKNKPDEQDKASIEEPIDYIDNSVGKRKRNSVSKFTKIHDGERYKCKICLKHFKTKKIMSKHSEIHEERKYVCEICDKHFTAKRYLFYHMKTHAGTNSDERSYKCEICGKCFFKKQCLLYHAVSHTDERNYKCEICSKWFKRKGDVSSHMGIHGERNYVCDTCNKRFSTKQNLTAHIKTHTGEKKYECDICNKRFTTKHTLLRHKKTQAKKTNYKLHTMPLKITKVKFAINASELNNI